MNWFSVFDDFYQEGRFDDADEHLKGLDPDALEPGDVVCVLSATYCVRERLSSRPAFLARAEVVLAEKLGAERAERLLKNRR